MLTIGKMCGTLHRRVLEMFGPDELTIGAVIVLEQVFNDSAVYDTRHIY